MNLHVEAVLREITTVREVRRICSEGGLLEGAMRALVDVIRQELSVAPGFTSWLIEPSEEEGEVFVDIAPDENWGSAMEVSFGLCMPLDPTAPRDDDDLDHDPYIYVCLPKSWPALGGVSKAIKRQNAKLKGFTDYYPPGDPDDTVPIWRNLQLGGFVREAGFDTDEFVGAVVQGFTDLLPLRDLIDKAIRQHPLGRKKRPPNS